LRTLFLRIVSGKSEKENHHEFEVKKLLVAEIGFEPF